MQAFIVNAKFNECQICVSKAFVRGEKCEAQSQNLRRLDSNVEDEQKHS